MTAVTSSGGFSLRDFLRQKAHDWVDERNAKHVAGRDSADGQLADFTTQNAYAAEINIARDNARLAGLLIHHSSGMETCVGVLKNATGEDLLAWNREFGNVSSDVISLFKSGREVEEKLRIRNEELAKGSNFPGWQIGSIPCDDLEEN